MVDFSMVFFTCDLCGESLKKKQIVNHQGRCRFANFSCMDCLKVFDRISYADHLKCITENEKYGGASYVAKPLKGEVKQDLWIQQVRKAIEHVKNPKLKSILETVKNHSNVPRKEAKFINFLKNSLRIRDERLCSEAWNAIKTECQATALIQPTDCGMDKKSFESPREEENHEEYPDTSHQEINPNEYPLETEELRPKKKKKKKLQIYEQTDDVTDVCDSETFSKKKSKENSDSECNNDHSNFDDISESAPLKHKKRKDQLLKEAEPLESFQQTEELDVVVKIKSKKKRKKEQNE